VQDGSKRRARLILILGVVLAIAAGAGTFFYASSAQTGTGAVAVIPTTGVLVAAREIPPKTTLTLADLRVQEYNLDAKPASALASPEQAVGNITTVAISIGEPILPSKFSDPKGPVFVVIPPTALDANGNIRADTPNYRALSITVPDASAVGGAIAVGDTVDIVFTMNLDPQKFFTNPRTSLTSDFTTKIILERVPILARTLSVYTIRTDAITAERLAYLSASGGQLQMLLRAPKDERATGTVGTTFQDMFVQLQLALNDKITAPAP
jgi:Flp pilus assembly protein CpaB